MAVVMTISAPTRKSYEAVMDILDLDADPPRGLICHAACEVDGHVDVTDVWETQGDIDTFFETRLGKAMAEVGIEPSQPPVFREAFNTYAPR
jgi:hypothetical protein